MIDCADLASGLCFAGLNELWRRDRADTAAFAPSTDNLAAIAASKRPTLAA